MDTPTTAIAGALLGKAYFADAAERQTPGSGRAAIWAATIGAAFPDIDVVFDWFTTNPVAPLETHRGITHSFVCLPLWAIALAALTRWFLARMRWPAPSFALLTGVYAAALAFHILTDLVTSYGTIIWAPVNRARPAWDLVFIIDLFFLGIVLVPQLAAWAWRRPEGAVNRAALVFVLLVAGLLWVERLAGGVGVAFAPWAKYAAVAALAAVLFLPARLGGARIGRTAWCRAGVIVLVGYVGLCFAAQLAARAHVESFLEREGVRAEHYAALPMPPAPTEWSGLVRTADGVWQGRIRLLRDAPPEFRFHPDRLAPEHRFVLELPEVKTYLWFARFPVVRSLDDDGQAVVELRDMRFSRDGSAPGAFTFRVTLDDDGRVVSADWHRD